VFRDPNGEFAALVYDLGMTYERFGWQRFNASVDWFLFREKWDFANYVNRVPQRALPKVMAACEKLKRAFSRAALGHPDGEQIVAEFVFTCDEVIHTARRTALRQAWLAADPAQRNPEEPTLRDKPAKALSRGFAREMAALEKDARQLRKRFGELWLVRNKRSRLEDMLREFDRLVVEYKRYR
jgi:hypothetical protein